MTPTREKYFAKWVDYVDNQSENYIKYQDDHIPTSWSLKKTPPKPAHLNSKRYIYFQKLKKDAKCELCDSKKLLVVDHCHVTRKIRGVLCQNCNHGLGKFKDDTALMQRAIKYLKKERKGALDYHNLKPIE